jgi:hypothetical protein
MPPSGDITPDEDMPDPIRDPEGCADWLFDAVSGTLRDRPDAGAWADPSTRATKAELWAHLVQAREDFQSLRRSLVESDAAFDRLHDWITGGMPLPDPWRRKFVPAPGVGLDARSHVDE